MSLYKQSQARESQVSMLSSSVLLLYQGSCERREQ